MKADKKVLAQLHGLVASELIEKLTSKEWRPADIMAAIKFLKDNDISSDFEANDKLKTLFNSLPFQDAGERDDDDIRSIQ